MKKRGISILGIIVFIGLVALIAWGLNYIITKDYVIVRPPTIVADNTTTAPLATSTPTSTPSTITPVSTAATTTPPKTTASSTPTTPSTTSGLTVTYTDKGFSPASLTVKKGQTVKFVNNSTDVMWVAANPFPSSKEYPTFTTKTDIAEGSSWSFTFDKAGTWYYHDHYAPQVGGKIIVGG